MSMGDGVVVCSSRPLLIDAGPTSLAPDTTPGIARAAPPHACSGAHQQWADLARPGYDTGDRSCGPPFPGSIRSQAVGGAGLLQVEVDIRPGGDEERVIRQVIRALPAGGGTP